MDEHHTPTRAAALERLAAFTPRMGRAYAAGRNTDPGVGARRDVSLLSPHVRHRILTESELVGAALDAHGATAADKFIQEVFWRSYWKGWLQMRPGIWRDYTLRAADLHARLRTEGGLRRAYETAARGETGIDAFDAWAHELVEHGWLHNHARMWFASIWVFTLRLPWVLGADLFLRHLKDGDAASNTLSWRWVIGSQTRGKAYVATADNIARHTAGRFDVRDALERRPMPIVEDVDEAHRALPEATPPEPGRRVALLLHEDDLGVESLDLHGATVVAVAGVAMPEARSPLGCASTVRRFTEGALDDALARAAARFGVPAGRLALPELGQWASAHDVDLAMPEAPVGWVADALEAAGVRARTLRRTWDAASWPLATRGFFQLREHIPELLGRLRPLPPS